MLVLCCSLLLEHPVVFPPTTENDFVKFNRVVGDSSVESGRNVGNDSRLEVIDGGCSSVGS